MTMLSSTSDLPFNSFSVEIVVSSILDHKKFLKERRKQIFFVCESSVSVITCCFERKEMERRRSVLERATYIYGAD